MHKFCISTVKSGPTVLASHCPYRKRTLSLNFFAIEDLEILCSRVGFEGISLFQSNKLCILGRTDTVIQSYYCMYIITNM